MSVSSLLDASALLAWLHAEDGADVVEPYVDAGAKTAITSVNLGEVLYKIAAAGDDPDAFVSDLAQLGIQAVAFEAAHAAHLPALKQADAQARASRSPGAARRRLSLADTCCLAYALETDATVVTGEAHWSELGLAVRIVDYRADFRRGRPQGR